jgi:hypothetical protein
MRWTDSLADAAVELMSVDTDRLVLRHAGDVRSFRLHRLARAPRPSELTECLGTNSLLVTPSLTVSAQSRLRELGWSWITDAGQLHLRFPGRAVDTVGDDGGRSAPAPAGSARLTARGIGTFAVVRRMLLAPYSRQVDLATATGLTQPRVSQILSRLANDNVVIRDDGGWMLVDWDDALQAWLSSYSGPRGIVTYWSGLDDVWSNTLTALDRLSQSAVLSGDVAADLLAPWRQPRLATVYVASMDDLRSTGLVRVAGPNDGTVAVCVPDDRTVWPTTPITRRFRGRSLYVADPVQVLRDVSLIDDNDAQQATQSVVGWVKNQYIAARCGG